MSSPLVGVLVIGNGSEGRTFYPISTDPVAKVSYVITDTREPEPTYLYVGGPQLTIIDNSGVYNTITLTIDTKVSLPYASINGIGYTLNATDTIVTPPSVSSFIATATVSTATSDTHSTTVGTPTVTSDIPSTTATGVSITPASKTYSGSQSSTSSDTGTTGTFSSSSPSAIPSPGATTHSNKAGTIAGAAVGTGVGAALLTFLLTFFIMRSRRRTHHGRSADSQASIGSSQPSSKQYLDKDPQSKSSHTASILPIIGGSSGWTEHLPQPADDETIRRTLKTILTQLELHVENFYNDSAAHQISEYAQSELYKLDSEMVQPSLYDAMLHSKKKTLIIKHSLAHLVLTRIDSNEPSSVSFLPLEYMGMIASLRSRSETSHRPGTPQALSQYRVLTAYLHPNPAKDKSYIQQRDCTIEAAATSFCNAFDSWKSHGQADETRFNNLIDIMRSASDFGILIYSQPATFEYHWRRAEFGRGGSRRGGAVGSQIVVLPAFLKVTSDSGSKLETPYVMVKEVSVAV